MTKFAEESVSEALERSIRNAPHLRARHSAAIAAARKLARKIDAWDTIVDWALEDAAETRGARPAVPANDNVSLASFGKYLDMLGLVPDDVDPAKTAPKTPAATATPPTPINAMRQRLGRG